MNIRVRAYWRLLLTYLKPRRTRVAPLTSSDEMRPLWRSEWDTSATEEDHTHD